MARYPNIDDFHNPEDALAAASKMDMHGDWNEAIELYHCIVERWPEHMPYITECVEAINDKQKLSHLGTVDETQPMTVGEWMATLFILAIPIVNIIMYLVWALREGENVNRKTYCQASLIWFSIIVALAIILSLLGVRIQG